MAKQRVEFRLSMPGVASWDGKWSGEGRNHVVYRSLSDADVKRLGIPMNWYHHCDDGWAAQVDARVIAKGERKQKSDGFHGYEWMVDNILRWGQTACKCEWLMRYDNRHLVGELECRWCRRHWLYWMAARAKEA